MSRGRKVPSIKHPALLAVLLTCAGQVSGAPCAPGELSLKGLLEAEYAFAAAAQDSLRQAFLANLSGDSWVLQPTPTPGRAWYQAAPETGARLTWYPQVADIAGSRDLGFSSGPWVYSKDASHAYGHFLTLWKLESDCRWRVLFDGGISHVQGAQESPLKPDAAIEPASISIAIAPDGEAEAFQDVAGREGLSAALRTFARNDGFLLLTEGLQPMNLAGAERRSRKRLIKGPWREASRGQSEDGSLRYVIGQVEQGSYVEIWQYDAKVANRALRVLMLTGH
jgi:hypothetical protein